MHSYNYFLFYVLSIALGANVATVEASQQSLNIISSRSAAQAAKISARKEQELKAELEKKSQTQTMAILKGVTREISLTTNNDDAVSLTMILRHPDLLQILAGYAALETTLDSIPRYQDKAQGIINEQNLCYIIAPLQIAWALQTSLHKKGKLPQCIGLAGSDICTLFTTALKEHEKQEKTSAASSAELLFPVRDWLQQNAPEVYGLKEGQSMQPDSLGFAHKVLVLYLKHLNQQCKDSDMVEPCPTIRLIDGSSAYSGPIVKFMPDIIEAGGNYAFDCEKGIKSALKNLFPAYPQVVHMSSAGFNTKIPLVTFPVVVSVKTPVAPVHYVVRAALLYDPQQRHSIALRRHGKGYGKWSILNDHRVDIMDKDWVKEVNEYNAVPIEHAFPTSILYERH